MEKWPNLLPKLRTSLAIPSAVQKIASDCGCDAMVRLGTYQWAHKVYIPSLSFGEILLGNHATKTHRQKVVQFIQ